MFTLLKINNLIAHLKVHNKEDKDHLLSLSLNLEELEDKSIVPSSIQNILETPELLSNDSFLSNNQDLVLNARDFIYETLSKFIKTSIRDSSSVLIINF